jgi:hypothetical protein
MCAMVMTDGAILDVCHCLLHANPVIWTFTRTAARSKRQDDPDTCLDESAYLIVPFSDG